MGYISVNEARKLSVAFCSGGKTATALEPREITFEEFAKLLAHPALGEKDGPYYIRGGDLTTPLRANDHLRSADLVILDGDSGFDPATGEITDAPPMGKVTEVLDQMGLQYVAHTSYSYIPGQRWKYRVIIPAKLKHEADLKACVGYVIHRLHKAGVYLSDVKENSVWAQPWYLPRVPDVTGEFSFKSVSSLKGKPLDVSDCVAWYITHNDSDPTEAKVMASEPARPSIMQLFGQAVHDGPSPIEKFNAEHGLEWVQQQLVSQGYKFSHLDRKKNVYRYIRPGSETGIAGVIVFQGKHGDWCTYSHHGGQDPLSHKLCDPFEIFAIFQHGGDRKAAAKALMPERPTTAITAPPPDPTPDRIFIPSAEFASAWRPADYIVDGLIQRGYCYSLTSPTGHGKTSVILNLAACIGTGRPFAGCETITGRVGYFAAENPNDVQARWIGMQESMKFSDAAVWFCQDTIDLQTSFDKVAAEAEAAGGFDLIVVDTSQAFFRGDDENSNAQAVGHAKAMRRLTRLPGNPCVIILTHPVKNPSKDNLLPRGGGGFLAEVDGNLTLWNDSDMMVLHHQGKLRGPGFAPVNFMLRQVNSPRLADRKGRAIPTVMAEYISEDEYSRRLVENATDQDKVMILILSRKGNISVADIARINGWVSPMGVPNKAKVSRLIKRLKDDKLVSTKRNGRLALTKAGEREISAKAKALGIDGAGEDGADEEAF